MSAKLCNFAHKIRRNRNEIFLHLQAVFDAPEKLELQRQSLRQPQQRRVQALTPIHVIQRLNAMFTITNNSNSLRACQDSKETTLEHVLVS